MFAAKNAHKIIVDFILDAAFVRAAPREEPGRAPGTRLGGQGEVYGLLRACARGRVTEILARGSKIFYVHVSTTTKDVSLSC